jgi:hypothetical protein
MLEGFLLGIIFTCSLAASAYFFKFYRRTGDILFLAFAIAFAVEGFNRIGFLLVSKPNEGSPTIYIVRLLAFLLILAAILWKNRSREKS